MTEMTRIGFFILLLVLVCVSSPVRPDDAIFQHEESEGMKAVTESLQRYKEGHTGKHRPGPAHPEWEVYNDVRYEYYALEGNTFSEMIESMKRLGPIKDYWGKRAAGRTSTRIGTSYRYKYTYNLHNEINRITVSVHMYNIHVQPHIVVTLPTIGDGSRLSRRELDLWNDYSEFVAKHENDHVRIIKENVPIEEIKRDIASLTRLYLDTVPGSSVDQLIQDALRREVRSIRAWWTRKVNYLNERYDIESKYIDIEELRKRYFQE